MSKKTFLQQEEGWIAIVALLAAFLLAAHDVPENGLTDVVGNYAYWLIRIVIEACLFVAALYAVERYMTDRTSAIAQYAGAMLLSLVPFTLAITSVDLILGMPELGINPGQSGTPTQSVSRIGAFAFELVYLFDNHAALCGLLFLPRLMLQFMSEDHRTGDTTAEATTATGSLQTHARPSHLQAAVADLPVPTFLDSLEPPLQGEVYWIEAQEHYVRVTTAAEHRMVLYRFSDAIRELGSTQGMQVHRSHWVAFSAVEGIVKVGQMMKLRITGAELVPVSRSYRAMVEERFSEL